MDKERLQNLLEEYFNNTIGNEDCDELLKYIEQTDPGLFSEMIDKLVQDNEEGPAFEGIQAEKVYENITSDKRFSRRPLNLYYKNWFRIAAVVVILLSFLFYFVNTGKTDLHLKANPETKDLKALIVPGGNKAVLTLSNGEKVALDQLGTEALTKESGVQIKKTRKGEIIYDAPRMGRSETVAFNKIETPRGGEYQVILADGTRVWLNAASSLSYPTAFNGSKREVRLTGEAYFEVAKSRNKPFFVQVNGTTIEVLGTHFNITSYSDESNLTTTLLEGSVNVTKNGHQTLLKPGQQAVVTRTSDHINVSSADIPATMAWKNGYFLFRDEDIKSIMKKISRWYDIEVEYRGNVEEQKFGGTFYRSKSFSELLHYLEKLGSLHFKIEGRRVIVTP